MTTEGLGTAFGPSGKAGGRPDLSGMLPPNRPTSTPPPETAAPPAEAPEPESETAPPPSPELTPAAEGDSAQNAGAARQLLTFVVPEVKTKVKARKRHGGETNAEIAFDAIDATADRLPDLVAARHTKPAKPGSLFPARTQNRTDGRDGTNRQIWSFRATPAEIKVIDDLVEQVGAESRSELLSVALEEHFGVTPKH